MSKKKILLIAVAVAVGVVVLFLGTFYYKFRAETKIMTPVSTGQVVPGIFAIKDHFVNVYLIKTDTGYVAIDAGNDTAAIEAGLKELGIAASDIKAVFLTHTDGDHIAAVGLFPGAEIYISDKEEQMINGTTPRGPMMENKLDIEHKKVKDGQVLSIDGITVAAILTPGHTIGSVCYLISGENLFTGDILSLKQGRVALFNEFFNMDSAVEKTSITKLSNLRGVKRIFTAHYGYAPDFKAAFKDWNK